MYCISWIVLLVLFSLSRLYTLQLSDKNESCKFLLAALNNLIQKEKSFWLYIYIYICTGYSYVYFKANNDAEEKQVPVFLTTVGGETYILQQIAVPLAHFSPKLRMFCFMEQVADIWD